VAGEQPTPAADADARRKEVMYKVAKCFQMTEVPLVIATSRNQEQLALWIAQLLGARVIRSSDPYPCTSLLKTLDRPNYVFLVLEPEMSDNLYLLARDYALDREALLRSQFGAHRIDPQHRLAIIVDPETLAGMPEDHRDEVRVGSGQPAFG
jgi:hypothetical protein